MPIRIWAVLLWGGFGTADDDGAPLALLLDRGYRHTEQRFYGRYLKLALFERVAGTPSGVIGGAAASPTPAHTSDRQTRRTPPPTVRTDIRPYH